MRTTLVFRMASGAEHEVTLPTEQSCRLVDDLCGVWAGRRAGPAHRLIRSDGTSVVINPAYVESVVLR